MISPIEARSTARGSARIAENPIKNLYAESLYLNDLPSMMISAPRVIGRDQELNTLRTWRSEGHSTVAIEGPVGVGKTALLRVIEREARAADPSAIVLIDLAGKGPGLGWLRCCAQRFGEPGEEGELFETLAARLASTLGAQRDLLIVLDHSEEVLTEVMACVQQWRRHLGQGVSLWITSQRPLPSEAFDRKIHLAPLACQPTPTAPDPPALALMLACCERVIQGFDPDRETRAQLLALTAALDGLPLSIIAAAPRLLVMTPQQLLDALRRDEGWGVDLASRLSATLARAWSQLHPDERHVLELCALFREDCSLEALQVIAAKKNLTPARVVSVLVDLERLSLLSVHRRPGRAPRYHLYRSLKSFVLSRGWGADPDARSRATRDLIGYYSARCRALHEPTLLATFNATQDAWIEDERVNLKASLDALLDALDDPTGGAPASDRIEDALYLTATLIASGADVAAPRRALIQRGLGLPGEDAPALRAALLIHRAQERWHSGYKSQLGPVTRDLEAAVQMADQSRDLAARATTRAIGVFLSSWAHRRLTHESEAWLRDAQRLARASSSDLLTLHMTLQEGLTMRNIGRPRLAHQRFLEALSLAEALDATRTEVTLLLVLGLLSSDIREIDAARVWLGRCCEVAAKASDAMREAEALCVLARLTVGPDRHARGRGLLTRAQERLRAWPFARLLPRAHTSIMRVGLEVEAEDFEAALRELEDARQLVMRCGDELLRAPLAEIEALLSWSMGKPHQALRVIERARPYPALVEVELLATECALRSATGEHERARSMAASLTETLAETPDGARAVEARVLLAHIDLVQARAARARGDDVADAHLEAARAPLIAARRLDAHERSSRLRIAERLLERELPASARFKTHAEIRDAGRSALLVNRDATQLRPPMGDWERLDHRPIVAALLRMLCDHHHSRDPHPLSHDAIVEALWEGEKLLERAAKNRLYNAVAQLRAKGLKEVVCSDRSGYWIDRDVTLIDERHLHHPSDPSPQGST